jgi:hypothetical protein
MAPDWSGGPAQSFDGAHVQTPQLNRLQGVYDSRGEGYEFHWCDMNETSDGENATMRGMQMTVAVALVALVACGKTQEVAKAPSADSVGMMAGAPMAMRGMQMFPMMGAHLDSLGLMTPPQMIAAMASHQALATQMMDGMGADMRGTNITADAGWTALSDSVGKDLAELPALSSSVLQIRMQAHIGRMRRMMTMHQGMMGM